MTSDIDKTYTLSTPRKNHWLRWLLGFILLALLAGGIAFGVWSYRWDNMSPQERTVYVQGFVTSGVTDFLELRPEQERKLDALSDAIARQRQQLPLRKWHEQSLAVIAGTEFKREQAQALINEMAGAGQKVSPPVLAAMADFYDSLDPSQQEKLRTRWADLSELKGKEED